MITQRASGVGRRVAGAACALGPGLTAAVSAWAATPADAGGGGLPEADPGTTLVLAALVGALAGAPRRGRVQAAALGAVAAAAIVWATARDPVLTVAAAVIGCAVGAWSPAQGQRARPAAWGARPGEVSVRWP